MSERVPLSIDQLPAKAQILDVSRLSLLQPACRLQQHAQVVLGFDQVGAELLPFGEIASQEFELDRAIEEAVARDRT